MKLPPKPEQQIPLHFTPPVRTKRGQLLFFGDYAKSYRVRRPSVRRP